MITIEIDKLLIDREYINFFVQMYMKWRKDAGSTSSFQALIIPHLPHFEKMDLSQFKLYIEIETMHQYFVCHISKRLFSFDLIKAKTCFWYFTYVKDPNWFVEVE